MSEENYKKSEGTSDRNFSNRGGSKYSTDRDHQNARYSGREPRPRFTPGGRTNEAGNPNRENRYEGGSRPYRPRVGEGSATSSYRRNQYPGTNHNSENRSGGYHSEGNNERGSRPSSYGTSQYNSDYRRGSSYGDREGGRTPRTEGYREDYQRREGSYREGGYQNRAGGDRYQSRPGGGYQNHRSGGYRPRTEGYDPNAKYSAKKRFEYKEEHFDPNEPVRLNKFLANAGICSRRDADKYIQAGVVSVNGVIVTELGVKILRTDDVKFHDDAVSPEKKVYVILNKPKDYVTTSDDPQNRKTVMDLVKGACKERIYPIGRLDRNTTGVLILTNDGDLASKLTHPKYLKKKIYHVYTDRNVTLRDMQQIAEGIELEDGEIKADRVEYASPTDKKQVGIEIHSGKNRIVRRMFESLGYKVLRLDRVYFAGLTKKNLRRGDWRHLTEQEVNMLRMGAFE